MNDFTLNAWLRHLIDVWDSKQNNPSICFPHLQIENGDIGDTEDLLETEETDPDREKEDRTKKKKYLGRINYKVSAGLEQKDTWLSKFNLRIFLS